MKHLKQEFDKLTLKEFVRYTIAAVGQIAAVVLVFMAMVFEPKGQIHSSVLYYYAEACMFTSILFGVSAHYSSELQKFKDNITEFIKGKKNETNS